jgi:hypothetical protein
MIFLKIDKFLINLMFKSVITNMIIVQINVVHLIYVNFN